MDVTTSTHQTYFFFISQFWCLGHSECWLPAGILIKTKIQSEMDVSPLHKLPQRKKGVNILKWIGDREIDTSLECMTKKVLVS